MTEYDKGLGRAEKLCLALSKTHFYYSGNAISYTECMVEYNIMAQPHGLTRSWAYKVTLKYV